MQLNSAAALLITLSHALPEPGSALGREARKLAGTLSHGASPTARDRAARLTIALLDAADTLSEGPDLLDSEWDA